MIESHEQRIARLTEMARKVWPDADVATGRRGRIISIDSSSVESHFALHCEHEHALDALEAALCVLAGEPPRWLCEMLQQAVRDDRISPAFASELLDAAAKGGAR